MVLDTGLFAALLGGGGSEGASGRLEAGVPPKRVVGAFPGEGIWTEGQKTRVVVTGSVDAPSDGSSEAEGGGEEEAVEGLQTNCEARLNMLNQSLGCNMLGMGYAISQAGLLGGFVMMACSLLLNRKTLLLYLRIADYAGVERASTQIGVATFGRAGQVVQVVMFSLLGFFVMVAYLDAAADTVLGLLALALEEHRLPSYSTVAIVCWACLLQPPTWIRSMNNVAVFSFVAFLGSIGVVLSVSAVCLNVIAHQGWPSMGSVNLFPQDLASFLNALPIMTLVFSCQAGGDVILATMKDSSEANQQRVVAFGQYVGFFMLYTAGALSYVAFGDGVKGDLLLNFPARSFACVLARVASLDAAVLSYMIMCIPCRTATINFLFGKNEAKQESSFLEYYGTMTAINVCALAVALRVTDLSLMMGMCGAVCINFVAVVLPPAFWIRIRAKPTDPALEPVAVLSAGNVPYLLVLAFGLLSVALSSYQVVQRMQHGP